MSSIHLWSTLSEVPTQGNVQRKWINSLSFWLEIIGVLLLTTLLAEPVGCSTNGSHRVIIVDTSASIQASPDWQTSLNDLISSGSPNDRVTIIAAGSNAAFLTQNVEAFLAREAIQSLVFESPTSDIENAILLANQLTTGRVDIWTDHAPVAEPAPHIVWHAIGAPVENIGVTYASWQPGQITLQVTNHTSTTRDVHLIGQTTSPNGIVFDKTMRIDAHSQSNVQWTPSSEMTALQVTIQEPMDDFPLDNTVWLYPPIQTPLRIATDLPSSWMTKIGLHSTTTGIFTLDPALQSGSPMTADILFTNRKVGGGPNTWRVEMSTSTPQLSWHSGPFELQRNHPLLYNVRLSNILWSYDPTKRLQGDPLISIGDIPVMTEVIGSEGRRSYRFNIGPNSTLFSHPDWPIFVNALLKLKRDNQAGFQNSVLQTGERLQGHGLPNGEWQLNTPSGIETVVVSDGIMEKRLSQVGSYLLQHENNPAYEVGVNLVSPEESDLRNRTTFTRPSDSDFESLEMSDNRLELLLWLMMMLCWIWDWRITR